MVLIHRLKIVKMLSHSVGVGHELIVAVSEAFEVYQLPAHLVWIFSKV